MKAILVFLVLSQLLYAKSMYSCDDAGYQRYLEDYPSKCGEDCASYSM